MKETIAQLLKIKDFPFFIFDKNNREIYFEDSDGFWAKTEYDQDGKEISYKNSVGRWYKREYDQDGKLIYYENSDGFWSKREHDQNGNEIYFENSKGTIIDNRPKVIELTLEQIADKLGMNVKNLRIKD
jgi:YD repeat-containing protein